MKYGVCSGIESHHARHSPINTVCSFATSPPVERDLSPEDVRCQENRCLLTWGDNIDYFSDQRFSGLFEAAGARREMHTSEFVVAKMDACLGADIRGVDLRASLEDAAFAAILRAWHDHLVLRFRNQSLSDPDLLRFSRRIGELDPPPINPYGKPWLPEFPDILVLSNVVVDGKRVGGLGNYEADWHTDMSYIEDPPMASLLYALEVPPEGGETGFANMYLAYDTLPSRLRTAVEGRMLKHDATYNSAGELRRGFKEVSDPRQAPGALHPVVRVHPETGRKALFLGRRRNGYIDGLPLEESEALLDELWAHATRDNLVWYQEWQPGDLIMWDNRCTLHRRNGFDPNSRRVMHRTQIKGSKSARASAPSATVRRGA